MAGMGPRQVQNRERNEATPEAPAAAVRYAGVGFLFGFLLCAILAGALMWLVAAANAAADRAASAAYGGSYGDADADGHARSARGLCERGRAQAGHV